MRFAIRQYFNQLVKFYFYVTELKIGTKIQLAILSNVILAIFISEYIVVEYFHLRGTEGIFVNLCINGTIAVIYGLIVSNAIINPLKHVIQRLTAISEGTGDLTQYLVTITRDETGDLSKAFNSFISTLHGIISNVAKASSDLSHSMTDFENIEKVIKEGSDRLNLQAKEMVEEIETLKAQVVRIQKNVGNTLQSSEEAQKSATEGSSVVQKTILSLNEVSKTVEESIQRLEELQQSSSKISTSLAVIKDIAEQTNLLALNAAIEAARAGEFGRGFAVVADEVRSLANNTSKATSNVTEILDLVQSNIGQLVPTIQSSVQKVQQGVSMANSAGDTLSGLVQQAIKVSTLVQEISQNTHEQSEVLEAVMLSIQGVSDVAQINTNSTDQIVEFNRGLSTQIFNLTKLIKAFKLSKEH